MAVVLPVRDGNPEGKPLQVPGRMAVRAELAPPSVLLSNDRRGSEARLYLESGQAGPGTNHPESRAEAWSANASAFRSCFIELDPKTFRRDGCFYTDAAGDGRHTYKPIDIKVNTVVDTSELMDLAWTPGKSARRTSTLRLPGISSNEGTPDEDLHPRCLL